MQATVILRDVRNWMAERYFRICAVPSTILALVLMLFVHMSLRLPLQPSLLLRNFLVTALFAWAWGTVLMFLWGLWSNIPLRINRVQRHWIAMVLVVLGIFSGSSLVMIVVAKNLGRELMELQRQIVVFNLFLSLVVVGVMITYEQMRVRLEQTLAQLKQKEINEQRLLRLKTQAELSSLQARINPHFLFNSLNTIASLVSVDPSRAETAVEKLSRLLRFSLRSSERRVVLLREEFDIIRTYLEIEKMRLGDRLHYDLLIRGNLDAVCVPGMLLQPLVENSIKHGLARKTTGGHIRVEAWIEGEVCRIIVADNGMGWTRQSRDGGIGLANIRERLDLYFGGRCNLELYNQEGAVVDISFPVEGSCSVP